MPGNELLANSGLTEFTDRFLGYGNFSAPIWFVGLEEGGGESLTEIEQRVGAWKQRGSRSVEDLAEYHRSIGVTRFFDGPRPVLQRTWRALMLMLQAYRSAPTDIDTLRRLQAREFGAAHGPAALLELLPLPSPSKTSWIYAPLAGDIPMLESRARYEATMRPRRIQQLRSVIQEHAPQVLVCYGMSERAAWQAIIHGTLREHRIGKHRCLIQRTGTTTSAVVPHPGNARATEFWTTLGATLRTMAH
jgi:hypothetical protein